MTRIYNVKRAHRCFPILVLDHNFDDHSFRVLSMIMFVPNASNDHYLRTLLPWTKSKIDRHLLNLIELDILEYFEE